MKKAQAKAKGKSLVEFIREKRRAQCRVCHLPAETLAQLKAAKGKVARAVMQEWLQKEVGIKLTSAELDAHHSGRHVNGY